MTIQYFTDKIPTVQQYTQLLSETTLGSRRPIDQPDIIQGMLNNSNLLISAWDGERLIGVARSVTDFHYCCYLSDLAVSETVQCGGIGKELIKQTLMRLKPSCRLNLLSAPQAIDYYPKIGFTRHNSAWTINNTSELI